jgi:hypothetical protein
MKASPSLLLRIIVLAAGLVPAIACTKAPNDAQVTSNIQNRLGSDSGLQNKQINVQAANGAVTLSGTVDNDAQREAAAKYAAAEAGVKQVINNLQVAPGVAEAKPSPEMQPEAATPEPEQPSKPARKQKSYSSPSSSHRKSQDEMAQGGRSASSSPASSSSASSSSMPAQSAAAQSPATMAAAAAPAPPPEAKKVTIPSGTSVPIRLVDAIDSATAQTGDTFHATLDAPIAVDGDVVIPAHYDVEGHVVNAQASGKFAGQALLVLQLDRIKVGERYYNVQTDQFSQKTGSRGKNTAEKVGAGAVAGAILGGIFGGGKGAAIGSVAGAGAGGGVQAASKKPDIKLSSEKILTFTLQAPVTVTPTSKPAREGQKLEANTNNQ